MQRALDIAELTYDDPDRADVADWLNAHGWAARAVPSRDVSAGWAAGSLPDGMADDEDAVSRFVTAERH